MASTKALQKILTDIEPLNRLQDAWIAVLNPLIKSLPAAALPKVTWTQVGAAGNPQFQNGWVNFDGGFADDATHRSASFTKDTLGWVTIRGVVKSGTALTTIFTLPVGFRPKFRQDFPNETNQAAFGSVAVDSFGNVFQAVGNNVYQYLDTIRFLAEN